MARNFFLILLLLALFAPVGCNSGPEVTPEEKAKKKFITKKRREADTEIKKNRFAEAFRTLKSILESYPEHSEVYLYMAQAAQSQYRWEQRRNKSRSATYLKGIEYAKSYYKNLGPKQEEERGKALILAGAILQDTFANINMKRYQDALDEATNFGEIVEDDNSREAKYFLGCLALYQYKLTKASRLLQEAKIIQASELLNTVRRLEKSPPESDLGKKLVFRKKIDRGNASALYFHELKNYKLPSRVPGKYIAGDPVEDIESHWARQEIIFCLTKGVLDLGGANRFWPQVTLLRIEAAMMVTHTLIIATGSDSIKDKYQAVKNPFKDSIKDFGEDALTFAITAWKEGYMKVGADKKFYPKYPLSGLELLGILNKLKTKLQKKQ